MKFPLILDGATGTMLQAAGMPSGVCTEQWVLEQPEILQNIQRAYAAAGSGAVYAPTFGANSIKLASYGIIGKTADMNRQLTAVSREAVGYDVLVGGDMAPTGKLIPPMGDTSFEEMVEVYTEQARALEEAGVDFYGIETAMTLPEARAALLAVRSVSSKPVFVTFTVDEHGRTLTGTDGVAALTVMQAMGADAFGFNCSTGPDTMLKQLKRLTPHARVPLIAKPNAGLPEIIDGKTVYHCSPDEFTALVPELWESGVRVFGGCCGTTPEHIAALSKAVSAASAAVSASAVSAKESAIPAEIALATEKDAFFFGKINAEDRVDIACGEDLLDDLLDAEDGDETFIRLSIGSEDDLETFAECQYAVKKPLILSAPTARLLESALRLYQGVALCETGSIPGGELERLSKMYGCVIMRKL